jgi:nucleoid-associated protein YgaU
MTRDNKIGLLIGLAVIILAGVLLGDYVTAAAKPEPRSLVEDVESDRSVVMPTPEPEPPVVYVPPPEPVFEQTPTPEPEPVEPRGQWAGLTDASLPPGTVEPGVAPPTLLAVEPISEPQPVAVEPEPIEERDAWPVREYVARPGDSLAKIARTQLGGDTEVNRAAIIALNSRLADDPNRVLAGSVYYLPGTADALPEPEPRPVADATLHIVRSGDSLWTIAAARTERTGDVPAMIEAIRALNPKDLSDTDQVRIGQKLKMPR